MRLLNCGGGSAKMQDCGGSVVRSMECSGSVRLLKCCCGVAGLRRHGMIVGAWRRVIAEMLLRVGEGAGLRGVAWLTERAGIGIAATMW